MKDVADPPWPMLNMVVLVTETGASVRICGRDRNGYRAHGVFHLPPEYGDRLERAVTAFHRIVHSPDGG